MASRIALLAITVFLGQETAFPPDDPAAHGIAPEALARLSTFATGLVDSGEVVGCELAVIHDGRTLLHESHGWRDEDEQRAMENGTLFCVRSMTKPLVGTAIQMLIDEKKLSLSDRIASLVPSFDTDALRSITVEMLLEHTSGLPLTVLLGHELSTLQSVRELAELAAECTPDFEPGTRFQYSDTGTDTLTALVEIVSGQSIETFLSERILAPLGMKDAVLVMREDEPRRARAASQYGGGKNAWMRFWSPTDEPIFPVFLGSQGMYCTIEDYARFLDMWSHWGRAGETRLLSMRAVKRALEPGEHPTALPTGFQTLSASYGQLMELLLRKSEEGEDEVFGFGHTGSDGTLAWVFPDRKLMVFLFTQARGSASVLWFEHEVETALLDAKPVAIEPPPSLEPFLGSYRAPGSLLYRRFYEDEGRLMFEVPGAMTLVTRYLGGERWTFEVDPSSTVRFERDDTGAVVALLVHSPGVDLRAPRVQIEEGLPSEEEILEMHRAAHHLERLADVPAVRLSGVLSLPARKLEGTWELLLAAPDRYRMRLELGGNAEAYSFDGEVVRQATSTQPVTPLDGRLAAQAKQSSWPRLFGDWSTTYASLTPMYRDDLDGEPVLVVRGEPRDPDGRPATFVIDEKSGRLVLDARLFLMAGMGELGASVRFSDWRDVEGMTLPFQIETEYPTPLLGTMSLQIESAETLTELPADAFALE